MNSVLVGTIILALLLFALAGALIRIYNNLVMLNNNISKAYANVDVILKQRADEVPNLVKIVQQFTNHETEVLHQLTELRTRFLSADSVEEKIDMANDMSKALSNFFAVSENYPVLKSSSHYLELQRRISGLEEKIADRREYLNDSINLYNIAINQFPELLFASILKYEDKKMLEITPKEKEYNGVEF